jgi:methyltransferase (TIGR00027 family)
MCESSRSITPDTQAWKRERLVAAGIEVPSSLRFAPVDFEQETLSSGLAAAGFDRDSPAFFVWLGVVPYLTRDAVASTLRFIAGLGQPNEVVFDYREPLSASAMSAETRERYVQSSRQVAAVGEPIIGFFAEEEIAGELRAAGFDEIDDVALAAALSRYAVATPSEGDPATGGHLVHATCTGKG